MQITGGGRFNRIILPKIGEMFWNSDDYHSQMSLSPVGSKLKFDAGQHIDHNGVQVCEFSGYCPRIPPTLEQCNGSLQRSVLWTYTSDECGDLFHPAALDSYPSKNAKTNHTHTEDGCSAD